VITLSNVVGAKITVKIPTKGENKELNKVNIYDFEYSPHTLKHLGL